MEKAIVIENRKKEAADYKAALDAMGFETEVAYSGGIGSKYMHETDYAFALIDHKLPDMTGCDLIREVRRDGITTPILGMSRHVGSAEQTQRLMATNFYRADTSDERPGAGIGIPLVVSTVALYGGTFSCDSAPGKGTTITVTLPLDMTPRRPLLKRALDRCRAWFGNHKEISAEESEATNP